MSKDINWSIIGAGDVCKVKSGPAFNAISSSKLKVVMRRDLKEALKMQGLLGAENATNSREHALSCPDVNSVYIATPPASHKDLVIEALQRGLHVYVEKPLALTYAEAKEVAVEVDVDEEHKLVVAHYRRALDAFKHVKDLVCEDGALGTPRVAIIETWQACPDDRLPGAATKDWRIDPAIAGGGRFNDLSPHQLDLMFLFFGDEVVHCSGHSLRQVNAEGTADDNTSGTFVLRDSKSGRLTMCSGTWVFGVRPEDERDRCTIVCDKGRVEFNFFGPCCKVRWEHTEGGSHEKEFVHPVTIQRPFIAETVQYFQGAGPNPCDVASAMKVMHIMSVLTGVEAAF